MTKTGDDLYRTLFKHSADAMLVIDGDRFVDCNQATLDMLGYSNREELFAVHPSQLSPPTQPDGRPSFEKANEMIALARETGSHRFTWMHVRRNGQEFPVEVLLTAVPGPAGDLIHVVWRDITLRVEMENELVRHRDHLQKLVEEKTRDLVEARDKAERANVAKSRFFRNMSHELRTPLNAIIGLSGFIQEETLGPMGDPKYREYVDDIAASGQHLLELINDILDVSAIEAEKLEIHAEPLDVLEVADDSLRLTRPLADKYGVSLSMVAADDLPILAADRRRLKQILLNLLSNAVKFTLPGGEVSLCLSRKAASGLEISVIDSGVGMDSEDLACAMTKFGQVDSGLDRRREGTGLGLPLTKGLVDLHGGTLVVASEKGVGTTVTVCFPPDRLLPAALGAAAKRDTRGIG